MDKTSYVRPHVHLSDISTQHIITFGKYAGGILNVFCLTTKLSREIETPGNFKEIDGRYLHYVAHIAK